MLETSPKLRFSSNSTLKITFFLFLGVTIIGLYKILLTGTVSWDEPIQLARTLHQLAFGISTILNREIEAVGSIEVLKIYPYGIIQKLPATFLSFLLWINRDSTLDFSTFPFREYYSFSHIFTFIYAILTCWLILLSSIKSRINNYWLAPLLLISTPIFMGHSFFNIKDIPLAFLYTLFTYSLVNLYNSSSNNFKIRNILSAIIAAAFCSLKITTLPIIILEYSILLFLTIRKIENLPNKIISGIKYYISFLIIFFLFTIIVLPVSWSSPLSHLIDSFYLFTDYAWQNCMNVDGICSGKFNVLGTGIYPETNSSWSTLKYIFQWFSLKLSILNILCLILSLILFVNSFLYIIKTHNASTKQITRFLYGFQLTLIPLAAIIFNSNLYDGIRHILFIFPAICYLGSDFADLLLSRLNNNLIKSVILIIFTLILFVNFIDFAALTPYQYTYINEFNRNRHLKGKTDLDYWGVSVGELYSLSRNTSEIFPDHIGPPYNFRKGNEIKTPSTNKKYKSKMIYRPPSRLDSLPLECREISTVQRTYPITNHQVNLSSLIICPNTK